MTQEMKILVGIGIATVVLLIGAVFFLSNGAPPTAGQAVDINALTQNAVHKIEYPDAKVTITEFADYECPACAAYNSGIKQFLKEYEGKVNYSYRHFPLPQHRNARPAINAAEAAGEQGKFFEMSDLLYARQSSWSGSDNAKEVFISLAKELQLDEQKFISDMNANKYDDKIQKDLSDARSIGVNSTPTIYINDKKLEQAPTPQNLKSAVDNLLNKQ